MKNLILALLLLPSFMFAHGDEEHAKGAETKGGAPAPTTYLSAEASSEKYEVLVKYNDLKPAVESKFQLYISEYLSNKPLDSAIVKLNVKGESKQQFTVKETDKGIYEVVTIFEDEKPVDLLVQIQGSSGNDLILVQGIKIGATANQQHEEKNKPGNNDWLLFGGGLLSGLLIMFILYRLNKRRTSSTLLLLLFLLGNFSPSIQVQAHEGHDDENKKKGMPAGSEFVIPKETQFLFDVFTEKAENKKFEETIKLFGNVTPSSNGKSVVSVPQSGKIQSLSVTVGQTVKQGATLATVEQFIDASNQVTLLAEKNSINAEFEIAEKEYERMKQLKDVVSKKEFIAAEANYNKAKENKELFNSSNGRTIILRSPIDGVVGNFTYAVGSTVNANEPVFSITNLSMVYVEAQVFDKDAGKVAVGARFVVECINDDHKTAEVTLIALAQSINPTNQSQRVLFQMQNSDENFKIGEFVNIRVFAKSEQNKMVLPNSALSEINGKPVVFVKNKAEQYSVVYVSTGENNGDVTVINKGIEEGERIVVNGTYQMKMIYLNQ